MLDLPAITAQCGAELYTEAIHRIISVESSFNPYAIGVVGGRLARQPVNKEEAIVTARYLANAGWNFSMGLAQINRYNLSRYALDYETVFEPCSNLRAAASIYQECYDRALKVSDAETARLKAFSCYYSGNFSRGFIADAGGSSSYVQRIANVKMDNQGINNVLPIPVLGDGGKDGHTASSQHKGIRSESNKNTVDSRRMRSLNSHHDAARGIKQLRGD